ncbi:MAG: HNH endonuclease [Candidatus Zixiibacteriota bacterium]|nr:MAG: HNH endonuclease [candidate division Zixibacteria bacterium]
MKDQIISYRQMCDIEQVQTLQRGMNFRLSPNYSVILMSQRKNAPYNDKINEDGSTIEYEGHDIAKTADRPDPKKSDQPRVTKTGKLTQNGLFAKAVEGYREGLRRAEIVRIYEKLFNGVWSERGFFRLIEYNFNIDDSGRRVFRFVLEEVEVNFVDNDLVENLSKPRSRIIPSEVKREVWERDHGKCVICGSTDELHFDHDLPYSKGGTSVRASNVRILCARHNLAKSARIE